jgi:putative intracellular protease/amidase
VKSFQETSAIADYGFNDCPKLDLIIVPGGFGVLPILQHQETLKWQQT